VTAAAQTDLPCSALLLRHVLHPLPRRNPTTHFRSVHRRMLPSP
jgi:hypothetical protein